MELGSTSPSKDFLDDTSRPAAETSDIFNPTIETARSPTYILIVLNLFENFKKSSKVLYYTFARIRIRDYSGRNL